MRRVLRYLVGSLTLLLLLGNSNCSKNNDSSAPQFVTSLTVEDASNLPTSVFASGATIQFVLTIRNRSNSNQSLFFNGSEECNFAVVDAGTATVEWTDDTNGGSSVCAGSGTSSNFGQLDFTPGETKTFTVSWNQLNDSGSQVATGNYEVIGGFTVYNTTGAGGAADTGNSMSVGPPTASQLFPTVYRSNLMAFTIQ
ncbi:MAG: hypothetical protein ACM3ZT_07525 [Bacillota bacterium]